MYSGHGTFTLHCAQAESHVMSCQQCCCFKTFFALVTCSASSQETDCYRLKHTMLGNQFRHWTTVCIKHVYLFD